MIFMPNLIVAHPRCPITDMRACVGIPKLDVITLKVFITDELTYLLLQVSFVWLRRTQH
jgi:hypothetical protein